jgi:hypothetical protein
MLVAPDLNLRGGEMKLPWLNNTASDEAADGSAALQASAIPAGTTSTASQNDMASAFVVLKTRRMPRACDVVAAIKKRVPEFSVPEEASEAPAGSIVAFGVRGAGMTPLMFLDAPNPMSQSDSCVSSAWWWPDDWEHLRQRQGHVAVTVSHRDAKQRSLLMAQLAAGIVEATDAMAVVWNPADAVWPSDTFLASVDATPGELPLSMVVAVKIGNDTEKLKPDGKPSWFAITEGLAAFGLMEIEVRGYPGEVPRLCGQILNIAGYLIDQGAVIGDGHTIGGTPEDRTTVRHLPSTVRPGTTVYRIDMTA